MLFYSVYRLAYGRCLVWIGPKSEWCLALTGTYLSHCLYLLEESQTSSDKGAWATSCSPITDLKWSMPHFLFQGLADCLELSIARLHNFSRKLVLHSHAVFPVLHPYPSCYFQHTHRWHYRHILSLSGSLISPTCISTTHRPPSSMATSESMASTYKITSSLHFSSVD